MALRRTSITVHAGLSAECTVDDDQKIGELHVGGRSYGFTWTDDGRVEWDRDPPYAPAVDGAIREMIGI